MNNYLNQLETPQVVIGKADIPAGGAEKEESPIFKDLFLDFEQKRAGGVGAVQGGPPSIAEWYSQAVSLNAIFLSTLENSDIKSFSHKLNSDGSPTDQGMFSVEVLDPTNTFEAKFFEYFYEGLESYVDFIPKAAEDGTITSQKIVDAQSKISQIGRSRAVYVTFGSSNDPRLWAPVQKSYLASIEYNLTKEGVKRLVINFVSNLGLLNFSTSLTDAIYYKSGAETHVAARDNCIYSVPFSPPSSGRGGPSPGIDPLTGRQLSDLHVAHPMALIESIITQLFRQSTTSTPIVIIKDLEESINKAWSDAVFRATHQMIKTVAEVDISDKSKGVVGKQNWEEVARNMAEGLRPGQQYNIHETNFNSPALINATNLTQAQFGLFGGYSTVHPNDKGVLSEAPLTVPGGGRKMTHWQGPPSPEVRNRTLKEIVRRDIMEKYPDASPNYDPADNKVQEFAELAWGIFSGMNDSVDAAYDKEAQKKFSKRAKDRLTKKRMAGFLGDRWPGYKVQGYGQSLGFDIHNVVVATGITISTLELYKIYLSACQDFYTKLGFVVSQVKAGSPGAAIPGASRQADLGDPGTPINKLVQSQITPVSVTLKAKGPAEIQRTLENIFRALGELTTFNPTFQAFSELKLVERCQEYNILSPKQSELFLVASWETIVSLVDADETVREERQDTGWELYQMLFEVFRQMAEEEPWEVFPELFKNLGFRETILSKHTLGGSQGQREYINRLEVAGSQENTFATNEEFNKALGKKKMPVFNYGFKNSNILNFDFNLQPWYGLLTNIIPTVAVNGAISRSIKDLGLTKKLQQFLADKEIDPDNIENIREGIGEYWDENFSPPPQFDFMGGETLMGGQFFGAGEFSLRSSWEQAAVRETQESVIYATGEKEVGDTRAKTGSGREAFIDTYAYFLSEVFDKPDRSQFLVTNPNKTSQEIANLLLTIRDRLATKIFEGKITTVPLYTLMSSFKTVGARALLYFIEPEMMGSHDFKSEGIRSTWLSGEYIIVGYEINISGNKIESSFNIVKKVKITRSQRLGFD